MVLRKIKTFRFTRKHWLAAAGLAIGMIVFFLIWIWRLDVSQLDAPPPRPTIIMDRYGQKASQLSSSKLSFVPAKDIPEHLKDAVLAVEDKRFYKHHGVDLRGTARALIKNITSRGYSQGGSTLTQQLAKNVFLTHEKSLFRKWREWAYALKLELVYSKEEILGFYLNRIYLGEGTWGIREAARLYFSKEVPELTLEEAALLAALPKAPTRYSPLSNKELALDRRNLVLSLMAQQGRITKQQYETSKASPIALRPGKDELKGKYSSYVDHVLAEAVSVYGYTEEQLLTEGLIIHTELDPLVQDSLEMVMNEDRFFPESPKDQLLQSAAVVLDHKNGGIRGLLGHRGEGVFRGFNRAFQMKRQPGSTFKPLAVYAPALEKGFLPSSPLLDQELDYDGYRPQNYDKQFRGTVTLEQALSQSLNVPAVWLLEQIGLSTGADFVTRAGIPLEKKDRHYAIALGGLSKGVSPLEMAQAYSAFANLGAMHQAHSIVRITSSSGKVLAEHKRPPVKVTDPVTAYRMTTLLQEAVISGTGRNAAMNRPTAGKSGTTQLPDLPEFKGLGTNTAKDAWFVGYTPELTAAVWLGYDKTDRTHHLTTTGGSVPAVLFREILSMSLRDSPVSAFPLPPEISRLTEKPDPPKGNGKKKDWDDDKDKEKDEDKDEERKKTDHEGRGKGKKKDD